MGKITHFSISISAPVCRAMLLAIDRAERAERAESRGVGPRQPDYALARDLWRKTKDRWHYEVNPASAPFVRWVLQLLVAVYKWRRSTPELRADALDTLHYIHWTMESSVVDLIALLDEG